jgi:hypothetical protein
MASSSAWKILQLSPATGWVARFSSGADGNPSEEAWLRGPLVDDGTRTFMVGMVAGGEGGSCVFAQQNAKFTGYFHRGASVPVAADLPQVQKTVKAGVAWKSAARPE